MLSSRSLVLGGWAVQKTSNWTLVIERERVKCIYDKQSLNFIKTTPLS